MQIAISSQLDDMNLSPEAYRLYVHLRCEMARQDAADSAYGGIRPDHCVDGSVLELNRRATEILDKCKIPYDESGYSILRFFLELIQRRMMKFRDQFIKTDGVNDLHIVHAIFLSTGDWQ